MYCARFYPKRLKIFNRSRYYLLGETDWDFDVSFGIDIYIDQVGIAV